MKLRTVTYEESRERFFKDLISEREEKLSRLTGFCNSVSVHNQCSELGCEISYLKDALIAFNNISKETMEKLRIKEVEP